MKLSKANIALRVVTCMSNLAGATSYHSPQRLAEMEYAAHSVAWSCGRYEYCSMVAARKGEPTLCGLLDPGKLQESTSTTSNLAGLKGQLAESLDQLRVKTARYRPIVGLYWRAFS